MIYGIIHLYFVLATPAFSWYNTRMATHTQVAGMRKFQVTTFGFQPVTTTQYAESPQAAAEKVAPKGCTAWPANEAETRDLESDYGAHTTTMRLVFMVGNGFEPPMPVTVGWA